MSRSEAGFKAAAAATRQQLIDLRIDYQRLADSSLAKIAALERLIRQHEERELALAGRIVKLEHRLSVEGCGK